MNRFVESLKISDGTIENIEYHNRRFNATLRDVFGISETTGLQSLIVVPGECSSGIFKCRVIYSPDIEKIEFAPYHKRIIRTIKLVYDNSVDYTYKYEDKTPFEKLKSLHQESDDILIVKNVFITDTSFSNVALYDGMTWFTPATPLLRGTRREKLLESARIKTADIRPEDLPRFKKISFINAMLDLEESVIDVNMIQ